MHKINPFELWKSPCPECGEDKFIYIYDGGLKYFWRFLWGDNRFACSKCKIAWRKKNPVHYESFADKESAHPEDETP